jgi:hypothetical protein
MQTQPEAKTKISEMEPEDQAWMDADLSRLGEFEPYEWEEGEIKDGKPIEYVPGVGLVIKE